MNPDVVHFWDGYLKGSSFKIDLPRFAPDFPGTEWDFEIQKPKLAKDQMDLEDVLLSAFAALLGHYSGQEDLLFATPLPLRLRVDLNLPFNDLLAELRKNRQRIHGQKQPKGIQPNVSFQSKKQKEDLGLTYSINGEKIGFSLFCGPGLYEIKFLKDMGSNFIHLLHGLIERPTVPMINVPFVTPLQQEEMIRMGKGAKSAYPNLATHRFFEEIVQKLGFRPALRFLGKTVTYAQLNEKANQLARHLLELGVKKGGFVGLAVDRSLNHIVGILGILKADAVALPIDGTYPLERKLFMIEDAKLEILVTENVYRDLFPEEGIALFCLDSESSELEKYSKENLPGTAGPLDLMNIIYTSGSTGRPKGVEIPHKSLMRLSSNPNWITIKPEDRILHMSNVSFDAAAFEIWGALLSGACLCIYPEKEFSADELAELLMKEKITHALFPARLFNLMVEYHLSSLKELCFLASAGDVMSAHHARLAAQALPKCAVVNAYGPTENGVLTTVYTIEDPQAIDQIVPIGPPISNTNVYILNSNDHLVPIGVRGELFAGGDGVARGYLNRPELTEEKFISSLFGKDKLYRTGDLAQFLPSGDVVFLGRIDTQVKIRGFRLELGEIEECLRKHPKVSDSVVIAQADSSGDKRLVGYVEAVENEELSTEELRAYLESELISNMIPAFLVILKELPVTPNGKVDRKALPAPEQALRQHVGFEPPKTPAEEVIADIWSLLLKIPRIGRQDNFFLLGGHSIAATEVTFLVGKAFSIEVPIGVIFEDSTLEKYAKRIKEMLERPSNKKGPITASELFWIWRNREVKLDPAISVSKGEAPKLEQYQFPKAILLTGATGFVGSFMLRELIDSTKAQIYCHVRADTESSAMQRIVDSLKKYHLWDSAFSQRIVPLPGDLEKPLLGFDFKTFESLGAEIDSIYHIGAFVNHALPYHKLKPANVKGTEEALRLACRGKIKPFHYVSTLAVFEWKSKPIQEDDDLDASKSLWNGYAQSKWVGEKIALLARSRGLPVSIYRLTRVAGHSKSGQSNEGDFLWRMAEASIFMKLAPDIGLKENITPVDFVCRAVRQLANDPKNINQQHHIVNNELFSYREIYHIFRQLGYPLEFVPYEDWRRSLVKASIESKENRLQAALSLFSEVDLSHLDQKAIFDCSHIQQALKGTGIECPQVGFELFKIYIDAFVKKGFFSKL